MSRETELRAQIAQSLSVLQEYAEARQEGVPIDLGDEVAENILRTRLVVDEDELRTIEVDKWRRPLIAGTWIAGVAGISAGVALDSIGAVFGSIASIAAVNMLLGQHANRQAQGNGSSRFVHPLITPTLAYRTAAENEKFNRIAMVALFGKDALFDGEEDEGLGPQITPVVFRQGEYPGLDVQEVHDIACATLAMRVRNLDREWPALRFHILYGDAGRGKTTLVKVLTQEIRDRLAELGLPQSHFVEAWGGDLKKSKKLDEAIRMAASVAGSVLFIDEIHAIPPEQAERMYLMTDRDFRYKFDGDTVPTHLKPFTIIGATTDLGKLHPAFRSRAELVPLELVPPEKLLGIAMGMPYPVDLRAAELVVSLVRWDGMPRAVVSLLEFAREFGKEAGRDGVEEADVRRAIDARRLDEWGLGPFHRDVVRALARSPVLVGRGRKGEHTVYKLSETSLLAMAKVDPITFREDLRPALMDRGFMVTSSGGQLLTDAGLAYAYDQRLVAV